MLQACGKADILAKVERARKLTDMLQDYLGGGLQRVVAASDPDGTLLSMMSEHQDVEIKYSLLQDLVHKDITSLVMLPPLPDTQQVCEA